MFKELIAYFDPFLILVLGAGAVLLVGIIIVGLWLQSRSKAERAAARKAQPPVGEMPPAPQSPQPHPSTDIETAEPMSARKSMEPEALAIETEQEDHYVVTVHYGTDREDLGAAKQPEDRYTDNRARHVAPHRSPMVLAA